MTLARTTYLLLWCLFFQKTESKPSNQDGNSLPEVTSLLEDYFDWKVDTYQFEYYISGINKHPGKLDDYSIERFDKIEADCKHFQKRADELLQKKGKDLKVRDRRYAKVVRQEAELCALGSKFKVIIHYVYSLKVMSK